MTPNLLGLLATSAGLALRRHCVVALALLAALATPSWSALPDTGAPGSCKTNWLYQGEIGLSTHYFPLKVDNREMVAKEFQVERVADQAADAGVSWFLLPLHHQPWIMMAPNVTFDRIIGSSDYTTQRDVPMEFSRQLQGRNIKLMLYVNLAFDAQSAVSDEVRRAMGRWPPNDRLIHNIAAVYREFSLRYGNRVSGWWVDAAGRKEYRDSPNRERWFKLIADALRAGNATALVAFNPGLTVSRYSGSTDFTAGETESLGTLPDGRWLDRAQWHEWTYLGGAWGSGGTRFSDAELGRYVSQVTSRGGALTFDVGTRGINKTKPEKGGEVSRTATPYVGYIDPGQIKQIKAAIQHRRPVSAEQLRNCVN